MARDDRQRQTGHHEPGRKHRRDPGQKVGRATDTHESAAGTTTNAKPAPFAALNQHNADESDRQDQMNYEDDRFHAIRLI